MEEVPKKVHVIGPSGTGKTTLAEKVAGFIDAKHINLDDIVYKDFSRRAEEQILEDLKELMKDGKWVTEGIYVSSFSKKIFDAADQIVWLDFPLHVNTYRVTRRFIKQKLTGKDKWGTISFLKLLHGTIGYSLNKNLETSGDDGDIGPKILENMFREYSDKLIRIRTSKEYINYLERVKT